MKLKMAENSLFAILLRSPWWISMALAAALASASTALLPAPYAIFGWMGALPFLVIGVIAARRQLHTPSAREVEQMLEHAAAMAWSDFRAALEQAYQRQGYVVTRLEGQAADLRLQRHAQTTLVAARRWKASSHGVNPLRALAALRRSQDASHCAYITLGAHNDNTRRFAQQHAIELVHGAALAALLRA